jgi:hypothetical protein
LCGLFRHINVFNNLLTYSRIFLSINNPVSIISNMVTFFLPGWTVGQPAGNNYRIELSVVVGKNKGSYKFVPRIETQVLINRFKKNTNIFSTYEACLKD